MRLQLPTDRWILEELQEGRNLGANIAVEVDRHKKTITRRLNQMEEDSLVHSVGNGVYEITPKGVATLRLIDQYERGEEFEKLVEERAELIEVHPPAIVDEGADES
ncbi:hypothetical protein JMJ58_15070 [Haloterrigena salifodinae]|uniref:PhiH1 repressor-like protein n=1 Tax=Haloterrigena salifodinae TaxID=2675099 RepID=A0A8T8E6U1_9EURY|nr:hypothetical protein JMJ58_15070 [Haloterrigena salifodinae]